MERNKLKIALVSSFTLDNFSKVLVNSCSRENLSIEMKYRTSYNLGVPELANIASDISAFNPQILFFFIDLKTFIPHHLRILWKSKEEKENIINEKAAFLKELAQMFVKSHPNTIIVIHNFEVPSYSPLGILDNKEDLGMKTIVRELNHQLEKQFKNEKSIFVFDYDAFLSAHGKKNSCDQRLHYIADMKLHSELFPFLADEYLSYIKALAAKPRKCIVLDLDNTLWGGIIGEDGFDKIKLGPTPPGNAFVEFQEVLLSLFHRGIILAVNSKNNPEDVLQVLRDHPHMVLREQHFSALRINWQDKAANIKEIADELNIGTDSMVFIDDDKHNCLLVKSALPEVLTILLPDDPSLYVETLTQLNEFNTFQLTEEDALRSKSYAEERQRRKLREQFSDAHDFLRNLHMKATIKQADNFTIPRISQLTNRTNQFNLTTRRYSEADISQFHNDPAYYVCSIQAEDKLGDSGIVGAAIMKYGHDSAVIDTFLMSCRVLGRQIETVLLHHLLEQAKSSGVTQVIGEYIPTTKNAQTKDFYKDHGFSFHRDEQSSSLWHLDLTEYAASCPDFIEIITKQDAIGQEERKKIKLNR